MELRPRTRPGPRPGMSSRVRRTPRHGLRRGGQGGRLEEAREILIRLGTLVFGTPDEATEAWVMSLNNLDRLHELVGRILDPVPVSLNWREFRLFLSRGRE